jgi:hypothetical protein
MLALFGANLYGKKTISSDQSVSNMVQMLTVLAFAMISLGRTGAL